jgi:adenylate kinase family enzyme
VIVGSRGIKIIGPQGCGKSTIAKALVEVIGAVYVEQDKVRGAASENLGGRWKFTREVLSRPKEELNQFMSDRADVLDPLMIELLQKLLGNYNYFVLEGAIATCEGMEKIDKLLDGVISVETPLKVREQRIRQRDPDNPLRYETEIQCTREYETGEYPRVSRALDEEWMKNLSCPVVTVDGTKPTQEILAQIMQKFPQLREMVVRQKTSGGKDGVG